MSDLVRGDKSRVTHLGAVRSAASLNIGPKLSYFILIDCDKVSIFEQGSCGSFLPSTVQTEIDTQRLAIGCLYG